MNKTLIEGRRLRLRRANLDDLNYIMELQYAPENLKFILPFEEDHQRETINSDGSKEMNVIVEELDTGDSVGYFYLRGLDYICAEYYHIIIGRKGVGYGREGLNLLLKWTFEIRKFHRVWIDCKDFNSVALNLYDSAGLVREGIMREILLTDGVYENLIVFGMLDREYFARYGK